MQYCLCVLQSSAKGTRHDIAKEGHPGKTRHGDEDKGQPSSKTPPAVCNFQCVKTRIARPPWFFPLVHPSIAGFRTPSFTLTASPQTLILRLHLQYALSSGSSSKRNRGSSGQSARVRGSQWTLFLIFLGSDFICVYLSIPSHPQINLLQYFNLNFQDYETRVVRDFSYYSFFFEVFFSSMALAKPFVLSNTKIGFRQNIASSFAGNMFGS